jgi:hypothetical protein
MSELRATAASVACLLRGLPLFFRASPRTPLRALGIIALDTLHVLRHSRPLTAQRVTELAMFLDLEGCTNALWDHKELCAADYREIRRQLDRAGLGPCIDAYLERLRELESQRPSIGGDDRHFYQVRAYREAVARLSLATAATLALGPDCGDDDRDVDTLFRILMQCQIIDDVMDYAEDAAAGLPSFLTASASLPQAIILTAEAARDYAATGHAILPSRLMLRAVSTMAQLVVRAAHWHRQHTRAFAAGRT